LIVLPELKRYIYKFTSTHSHTCAHTHMQNAQSISFNNKCIFSVSYASSFRLSCEPVNQSNVRSQRRNQLIIRGGKWL